MVGAPSVALSNTLFPCYQGDLSGPQGEVRLSGTVTVGSDSVSSFRGIRCGSWPASPESGD